MIQLSEWLKLKRLMIVLSRYTTMGLFCWWKSRLADYFEKVI